MEIKMMKKELQKIVKKHRDSKPDVLNWRGEAGRPEFPKAMLTGQQEAKRTATINFGYNEESSQKELKAFAESAEFKSYLECTGMKYAGMELNQDNRIQMRLYW